jgi:hypothetical protein
VRLKDREQGTGNRERGTGAKSEGIIHIEMSSEEIAPWKAVLYGHYLATLQVLILSWTSALTVYVLIHLFNNGHPLSMLWFCIWGILTISIATPISWNLWRQRIYLWREWLKQQNVDLDQTEKLAVNTLLVWPNRWFEIKK